MAKALDDVEDESDEAEAEGQVSIVGGRLHPGDKTEEVSRENENKQGTEEGDVVARLMHFGDAGDEVVEPFDEYFGKATQGNAGIGDERIRRALKGIAGGPAEHEQQSHHEPCAKNDRWQVKAMGEHVDEVNWVQAC